MQTWNFRTFDMNPSDSQVLPVFSEVIPKALMGSKKVTWRPFFVLDISFSCFAVNIMYIVPISLQSH